MLQSPKKLFVLGLMGWVTSVLVPVWTVAEAESLPPETIFQPKALNHTGIYALREIDENLTGSGVKFAVISRSITYIDDEPQNDYRPSFGHNCFKGKSFSFHDQVIPLPAASPHSTSICSILFGEDPDASSPELGPFYYQAVVPQASADIYEFWHFVINNVFHNIPPDADIVTASFGSEYEGWWTRGIESMVEHYGLIVVAGIGNGFEAEDPLFYPAASANIIGVGVVDSVNVEDPAISLTNFSFAYPEHSSMGPTIDRRCKPDIVAPGNCMAADVNSPSSYKPTGDWSSFSTPIVAGTIGLLVQKSKQDAALRAAVSPEGGNCVMKAILMNSANKLPYWHKGRLTKDDDHHVPLDYIQGAGMLNAVGAYRNLIAGKSEPGEVPKMGWDLNELNEAENPQNIYKMTLTGTVDEYITATVVWNMHYDREYPFEAVPEADADLRLELWAIDEENPNNAYLLDYSDSEVDNVEHIYFRVDPNYTDYEIVVSYGDADLPNQTAGAQFYGLAWDIKDAPDPNNILWYDLNTDGIVNEADFTVVLDNWVNSITSPDSYLYGDINSDGVFDVNDVQIFLDNINRKVAWYVK
ncbi:MAG: hypothetical protein AMJ75_04205 [Phycisphaerae bacterium SM1_79]|nr:MAG: hypothetical protein AMJ75_04205 [Phycisphaerae bacterium SM1_79]